MAVARKLKRKAAPRRRAAIRVKRAYDPPAAADGMRILIDRLWPRGVTKAALRLDEWPREIAPSNALRRWYKHDPERYTAFRKRYLAELKERPEALEALRAAVRGRNVTLVTATRDLDLSHAAVLRELLTRRR